MDVTPRIADRNRNVQLTTRPPPLPIFDTQSSGMAMPPTIVDCIGWLSLFRRRAAWTEGVNVNNHTITMQHEQQILRSLTNWMNNRSVHIRSTAYRRCDSTSSRWGSCSAWRRRANRRLRLSLEAPRRCRQQRLHHSSPSSFSIDRKRAMSNFKLYIYIYTYIYIYIIYLFMPNNNCSPNFHQYHRVTIAACIRKCCQRFESRPSHTGERPYKCDECDVCCTSNSGERPYKCDECQYCCIQSSSLARNKLTHSSKRPLWSVTNARLSVMKAIFAAKHVAS